MSGRPQLASLVGVLAGAQDEASTAWVQGGLSRWIELGGTIPLDRCLSLPSAKRIPIAIRDYWLAAALLECNGSVARLSRACVIFEARAWPVWHDLAQAPSSASRIERCLFLARKSAVFPGRRRLAQILNCGTELYPSLPRR